MKVAASPRIYIGAMPESGGGSDTGETHFQHTGGANPVSLRSTAPSRGRGENVGRFEGINPSFLWKEVPAGRRLGAQSGVKKERLKQAIYESTRAPLTRSPFPDGEGKLVATSPQNKKGDARRSLKCCLRTSPLFILCGASIWLCAAPLNLEHRVE